VKRGWLVPGGPVIDDEGARLRLRPPEHWIRVILEVKRTPPSINANQIRSNWRGFQKEKKNWQEEIGQLLMIKGRKRGAYQRAIAGGVMRFEPHKIAHLRSYERRDSGNYRGLVDKALGDALIIDPHLPAPLRYIPDDDEAHYHFSGVEFDPTPGPPRTVLYIYFQPKGKP
jgi:hypothetical protein